MADIIAKHVKTGELRPFPEPVFDAIEGDNEWRFVRYADDEPAKPVPEPVKPINPETLPSITDYQKQEIERLSKPAETITPDSEDESLDKDLYYVRGPKKGQLKTK